MIGGVVTTVQRAHKIRLNPTPEQEEYFRKACGTARFTYNWGLAQIKRTLDAKQKPPGWLDLKKRLNASKATDFPWMYEVTKCAVEGALADLGSAVANFWAGRKKRRKVGFPKFKKKGRTKDKFYVANDKFTVEGIAVRLPHIGKVAMTEPLRYEGKILSATVSRTANHWFVSITVEVEDKPVTHKSHVRVGVDLGLKTAVVLSTGKTIDAPKPLKKALKKLRRANRRLSRRQEGSANRQKAAQVVARIHERVADIRRDWLHKTATLIARRYSFVAIEDLNVGGMLHFGNLARSISDIGFGEFRRQLEYKVPAQGGTLALVNRFYPSSKTCRKCGQVKDMPLSERTYICDCGHVEDRDLNAARNILKEGIRTVGRTGTNACGQIASTPKRRRFGASKLDEAGNNVNSSSLCPA